MVALGIVVPVVTTLEIVLLVVVVTSAPVVEVVVGTAVISGAKLFAIPLDIINCNLVFMSLNWLSNQALWRDISNI